MTNRLVIHFPTSSLTVEFDNIEQFEILSNFCKKKLGAYHASEDINELTVDSLNGEQSNELHSLLCELGVF